MTAYVVEVTREGHHWLAQVPELEGTQTYAPSLTALDRNVREAIVLGADLPDEAMDDLEIDYKYEVDDDVIEAALELRHAREELAAREHEINRRLAKMARTLAEHGYSARDAGPLLGVSHQRISQLKASA